MEVILKWISTHHEVFGFFVASAVFLITIFLVSRKQIGFTITLLLLIFSLVAGFSVAYQHLILDFFRCASSDHPKSEITSFNPGTPDQKFSCLFSNVKAPGVKRS